MILFLSVIIAAGHPVLSRYFLLFGTRNAPDTFSNKGDYSALNYTYGKRNDLGTLGDLCKCFVLLCWMYKNCCQINPHHLQRKQRKSFVGLEHRCAIVAGNYNKDVAPYSKSQ